MVVYEYLRRICRTSSISCTVVISVSEHSWIVKKWNSERLSMWTNDSQLDRKKYKNEVNKSIRKNENKIEG